MIVQPTVGFKAKVKVHPATVADEAVTSAQVQAAIQTALASLFSTVTVTVK